MVIFGAGLRPDGSPSPTLAGRVRAALALGRRLQGPLYIPTGGIGRHGPSEAAAMAAMLREHGVADHRIVREDTARDTLASVLACAAILRARDHRGPVYAASSAYHLPRCVLLLRLAGVAARPAPPPPMPASSRWRKRWYWRLREVPALPWDAMLMLLAIARRRSLRRLLS
ncbi:YdcF family protein [Lichenicoccus roseus]|uniref:YdcF family protein n=1 Tax=Lichenicoccus roseus TaxID=2683649 RepID=A0A5R9J7N5_9PROT|nr:YdcF family protein [Lichenicoccus roseus]